VAVTRVITIVDSSMFTPFRLVLGPLTSKGMFSGIPVFPHIVQVENRPFPNCV
jgi:hypothetical protein